MSTSAGRCVTFLSTIWNSSYIRRAKPTSSTPKSTREYDQNGSNNSQFVSTAEATSAAH
jgi:hypothetical protein